MLKPINYYADIGVFSLSPPELWRSKASPSNWEQSGTLAKSDQVHVLKPQCYVLREGQHRLRHR